MKHAAIEGVGRCGARDEVFRVLTEVKMERHGQNEVAPKHSVRCAWQIIEGEAVVIDLATRRVMGLNPSGSALWSLIDGDRSVTELGTKLAALFDLAPEEARGHAETFVMRMAGRGLLTLQIRSAVGGTQ